MKYLICAFVLSIGFTVQATTSCHWRKERGSYWVSYDSNMVNPVGVLDCFYSIKKPVVLLENFEDGNEFEGAVFVKNDETNEIIESCPTKTVAGLNRDEFRKMAKIL